MPWSLLARQWSFILILARCEELLMRGLIKHAFLQRR